MSDPLQISAPQANDYWTLVHVLSAAENDSRKISAVIVDLITRHSEAGPDLLSLLEIAARAEDRLSKLSLALATCADTGATTFH